MNFLDFLWCDQKGVSRPDRLWDFDTLHLEGFAHPCVKYGDFLIHILILRVKSRGQTPVLTGWNIRLRAAATMLK